MFDIFTVEADPSELDQPRKFFINCPIDIEMQEPECTLMELPRELAKYIFYLEKENKELKDRLEEYKG